MSNNEAACEREIYSLHPVVPTPCNATVPTQGVGPWNLLFDNTIVTHSFCKRELKPQLVTRSSCSAHLPTLAAPESFQQDMYS